LNAGISSPARPRTTRTFFSGAKRVLSLPIVALAAVVFLVAPASQSSAQEDEGNVSDALSEAIEAYLDAQDELASLKQQQEDLEQELADSEAESVQLRAELDKYAYIASTTSDMQSTAALMASGNAQDSIAAMELLQFLGDSRANRLNDLITRLQEIEATRQTLADNIEEQEDTTEDMEAARDEAARELAGSGGDDAVGPSVSDAPAAEPFEGDSNGCTEDDPSPADGCLTPRTLHALEQTQIAGFRRFVSCYRPSGAGEHPKGRACDFSSEPDGFGGDAAGEDYEYGQNLAGWLVENADALGVQYVIWYRQIWLPSSGWKSYTRAYGDPSSDHTNHVHLSIRS
jgi:peptidoglycan DL-endopeptidase CwlO